MKNFFSANSNLKHFWHAQCNIISGYECSGDVLRTTGTITQDKVFKSMILSYFIQTNKGFVGK